MLCGEHSLGCVPRENLKSTLRVLKAKTEHKSDKHAHAKIQQLTDCSTLHVILACVSTPDRNTETFAGLLASFFDS
jgi:hypothetical protein